VGRRRADARILATHDAADVVDLGIVGDDRHELREDIFLLVEREDLFALAGGARLKATAQLRDIVRVAWSAGVEHHIIGYVDESGDRSLARGLEPALHPLGRSAVGDASDGSAEESRAAIRILDPHRHRTGKTALNLRN